ncbi:hypothetical protein LJK88_11200 [Paenibacillus sp. P26]|nr:hypothetical protein LJK88_11200 [Paenibacillus sp. P26]
MMETAVKGDREEQSADGHADKPNQNNRFSPLRIADIPHTGAITAIIIEPVEIRIPEWISLKPNSRISDGVIGAMSISPSIATKTLKKTSPLILFILYTPLHNMMVREEYK